MKLDATDLRYITADEFRVLTAVGLGDYHLEGTGVLTTCLDRNRLEEP